MHSYYLQQLGITPWVLRKQDDSLKRLEQLQACVASCERCPLHLSRTQTVFARGHTNAKLMIIGEAPGFYEDKEGLPFVGKAGQLLNKMIECIGLTSNDVYIANVLKCRPPNNRDPQVSEIEQCSAYLKEQIQLVQPSLIMAVGRFSGQFLLKTTETMANMRGQLHDYQGIRVMVSYHPAYLLRNPRDKKRAYQDWLNVRQLLN